ncbi:MAG: hypothetical protein RBS68_03255 [Anaerolineales bacterium]|jgi:hypothetical protein|nr:hypothetical protein [Anaerolineales bacterium]
MNTDSSSKSKLTASLPAWDWIFKTGQKQQYERRRGSPRDKLGNLRAIITTGGQFTGEPIVLFVYSLTLKGEWQTT